MDWKDSSATEHIGINQGELNLLNSFKDAIIRDMTLSDCLPHNYRFSEDIVRLLMFTNVRGIREVNAPLHEALYDATVNTYFKPENFSSQQQTYFGMLLDSLTDRFKVFIYLCYDPRNCIVFVLVRQAVDSCIDVVGRVGG